jgi:hypothetical protein
MANTLKFIDMVANEALSIAHEQSSLISTVDRQYDDNYAKSGAKIGDTLRVRSPNKFKTRSGNAMDVADITETTQNITLATLLGVDMRFDHVDLTLKTDDRDQVSAFSKRYIEPAMSTLISNIEYNAMAYYAKATYNVAGSAGTAINTLSTPNLARAKLNQGLAPKGDRCVQMDSVSMASLVGGVAAYFNPSNAIGEQYREGLVARTSMADYYENERCWTLANSSDGTGAAINNGTLTSGITAITVDGLSIAPTEGTVFTIAGIYDVHPETKAAYSHLKQFVCASGCTTTNIAFSPALKFSTTDPYQNASGTPANDDALVFVGAESASYVQPLMYHKEAFQFVTADLPLVAGSDQCARKSLDGLSLRVWMDGDIKNNALLCRIDLLHGYAALRPEWACRMIGAAN